MDTTKSSNTTQRLAFGTRTIHAGRTFDPATGAVMMPIYATSTYAHPSSEPRGDHSHHHGASLRRTLNRAVALDGVVGCFHEHSGVARAHVHLSTRLDVQTLETIVGHLHVD